MSTISFHWSVKSANRRECCGREPKTQASQIDIIRTKVNGSSKQVDSLLHVLAHEINVIVLRFFPSSNSKTAKYERKKTLLTTDDSILTLCLWP